MPDAAIGDAQPVSLTIAGARPKGVVPALTEYERAYVAHLERLRDSRYIDFPNQVGIESRALCNASCEFCPYPTLKRKGDRMSDALLEKILTELEEIPPDLSFDVNLARVNEPFADRRVFEIMSEVNRRTPQANLWLFTNASPLAPGVVEKLRSVRNITVFVVSFNEHRAEHYERVMGIPFDRTVRNLDTLHEAHESGALPFTPMISKVGDGTVADNAFLEWVSARWPRFERRVTRRFEWFDGAAGTNAIGVPSVGRWQWFHLPILASGKVAHCCIDHEGDHAWGDANQAHILDIYNQPLRRALRLRTPDRHEVEACRDCSHYG